MKNTTMKETKYAVGMDYTFNGRWVCITTEQDKDGMINVTDQDGHEMEVHVWDLSDFF